MLSNKTFIISLIVLITMPLIVAAMPDGFGLAYFFSVVLGLCGYWIPQIIKSCQEETEREHQRQLERHKTRGY